MLLLFFVVQLTLSQYVLTYFDVQGRGEALRLFFEDNEIEYVHDMIQLDEWADRKAEGFADGSFPYSTLPVLYDPDDDRNVVQSSNILLYVGDKHDALGSDMWKTNEYILATEDWRIDFFHLAYGHPESHLMTGDAYDNYVDSVEGSMGYVQQFENVLTRLGTTYFGGSTPSVADYNLFAIVDNNLCIIPDMLTDTGADNLKSWYDTMIARPNIAAYIGSDPGHREMLTSNDNSQMCTDPNYAEDLQACFTCVDNSQVWSLDQGCESTCTSSGDCISTDLGCEEWELDMEQDYNCEIASYDCSVCVGWNSFTPCVFNVDTELCTAEWSAQSSGLTYYTTTEECRGLPPPKEIPYYFAGTSLSECEDFSEEDAEAVDSVVAVSDSLEAHQCAQDAMANDSCGSIFGIDTNMGNCVCVRFGYECDTEIQDLEDAIFGPQAIFYTLAVHEDRLQSSKSESVGATFHETGAGLTATAFTFDFIAVFCGFFIFTSIFIYFLRWKTNSISPSSLLMHFDDLEYLPRRINGAMR